MESFAIHLQPLFSYPSTTIASPRHTDSVSRYLSENIHSTAGGGAEALLGYLCRDHGSPPRTMRTRGVLHSLLIPYILANAAAGSPIDLPDRSQGPRRRSVATSSLTGSFGHAPGSVKSTGSYCGDSLAPTIFTCGWPFYRTIDC